MLTYEDIKNNPDVRDYIEAADRSLRALGYTEHSYAHVGRVAESAVYILESLGFGEHDVELVRIAAHLHDIGNLVNRVEHSQSGAVMAFRILDNLGMDAEVVIALERRAHRVGDRADAELDAGPVADLLGDQAADLAARYNPDNPAAQMVFMTDSYDTRLDAYCVLRPLGMLMPQ